ncbi:hypothetical protein [Sphingobacterium mizutaii]|uniref:hypothetical protein n=1 Tax=Sphingobacterium mizutaii TaxID=1010 RepID=UPI00162357C7|nr:hypothetical protein [Sphingobacterium mizutaii]
MKKYLCVILVNIACLSVAKSQSIDQTLRHINNHIKSHCWIDEELDEKGYEILSLNEDGLLTVQRVIADINTDKVLRKGQSFKAYIRNLQLGETERNEYFVTVKLVSTHGNLKDITYLPSSSESRYSSHMSILLNGMLAAQELGKALNHLLKISKENKNFIDGYFH